MMPCLNFKLQMIMLMKTTQEYEIYYIICLNQAKIQFDFCTSSLCELRL